VYLVTHRLSLAETQFTEALHLEPARGELHYFMAELRARQGAFDVALEELRRGREKPIEEVKFRSLSLQLEGQLCLKKALQGLDELGGMPEGADKAARVESLRLADQALDEAFKLAFPEEKRRLHQLREKVRKARERIIGPPPI
jgi:hypothetical protein